MATRTVRLDPETESVLQDVRRTTGLPVSEILKAGIRALRTQLERDRAAGPWEIFASLDLGPGGNAIAPSTEVRAGLSRALSRKHRSRR